MQLFSLWLIVVVRDGFHENEDEAVVTEDIAIHDTF